MITVITLDDAVSVVFTASLPSDSDLIPVGYIVMFTMVKYHGCHGYHSYHGYYLS